MGSEVMVHVKAVVMCMVIAVEVSGTRREFGCLLCDG